jgi:ferrous iron transport protein A
MTSRLPSQETEAYMKEEYRTLDMLKEGESTRVHSIHSSGSMRRRLQDIGLIEGTCVCCVQKSPAGDPAAYRIRGAIIALRRDDARSITVSP